MRITELLEAVRMGQKDLAGTSLDAVLLGFESEIFQHGSVSIDQFAEALERKAPLIRFARKQIKSKYGMTDLIIDQKPKDFSNGNWYIDHDSSIGDIITVNGEEKRDTYQITALEIVSPPMEAPYFFKSMESLFDFYTENDFKTNGTTGFHVGVSFKDKSRIQKLDPLKLMLLLGEEHLKSQFARMLVIGDHNVASRIKPLIKSIRNGNLPKDIEGVLEYLREILKSQMNNMGRIINSNAMSGGSEKSFTVAFFRISTQGYVEFRMLGGSNYHQRFEDLKKAILRFVRVMLIASDDTLYTQEYYTKVAKLLVAANNKTVIGTQDDEIDLALKNAPLARTQFYRLENGHSDYYADYYDDEDDIDPTSPENVAWRIVHFIEERPVQAAIPVVKRRILSLMKKKGIDNKMLISVIQDSVYHRSLDNWQQVCAYFGLHGIVVPEPKKDDYY